MNELITLPAAHLMEQGVLGAILIKPELYIQAAAMLAEADFHEPAHRSVWHVIERLNRDRRAIDSVTVYDELERDHPGQPWGDLVGRLLDVPRVSNLTEYARVVKDKARARALVRIGYDLQAKASAGELTVAELIAETQALLVEVGKTSELGLHTGLEITLELYKQIEAAYQAGRPRGIATTLPIVNDCVGGLAPGRLYVLAARPRVGKTALGVNWIWCWLQAALKVCFFSLEMTRTDIQARMLSAVTAVSGHKLLNSPHLLTSGDWQAIASGLGRLERENYAVCDVGKLAVDQMALTASEARQRLGGLDVVVIDYVQLLETRVQKYTSSRAEYVAEVSRAVKALAKEQNVPVLALAQLNRAGADENSTLENLAESDQLSRDADCVMILVRSSGGQDDQGRPVWNYRLKIEKNRNGPCGSAALDFDRETMTFTEAL